MSPILLRESTAWVSPGVGITPEQQDPGECKTSKWIYIIAVATLAIYNALELVVMVLLTFKRYRGLYFYSLIVAGLAIIPYTLGFAIDLLDITTGNTRWFAITLITIGWWPMVTGQAVVLWSRLHLMVVGGKEVRVIRWTKWMIIINAIILHVPTTVFTYGSNGSINTEGFAEGYNIMEKIQMSGFFFQEIILSSIYIVETFKLLRISLQADTRTTMRQLAAVNAVIIIMDLGLLGIEAASLYILQTMLKGFVYSVKLKLELAVLGKLVKLVGGSRSNSERSSHGDLFKGSVGFVRSTKPPRARRKRALADETDESLCDMDIEEFVDLTRYSRDVTRPAPPTNESPRGYDRTPSRSRTVTEAEEYEFARFEHVEDARTLRGCSL